MHGVQKIPLRKKIDKIENGFTLIEMLAVMVVFASIGTIILSTIFISLRGSKKSDSITSVRQNGNYALSQMVNTIRYAKTLDSPFPCVPPPSPTPTPTYTTVTVTNLDDTQTTFTCTTGPNGTISQNGQSLIDASTDASSVMVDSCAITCSQDTETSTPLLDISFSLSPKNGSGSSDVSTAINFETSVTLRNVSQ